MKRSFTIAFLILLLTIYLVADEIGIFWPGSVNICFSNELINNKDGFFEIKNENGVITTPFIWLNDLSYEYDIFYIKQLYKVKDKEWNINGRYPSNVYNLRIKATHRTDELLEILKNRDEILFAELDSVLKQDYTPNDPLIAMQWAIRVIEAEKAWDFETGSENVIIGIVDSGIKWNHPDLRENVYINTAEIPGITINWETGEITGGDGIDNDGNGYIDDIMGWDFCHEIIGVNLTERNNPYQVRPGNEHGTHVSGCAAAEGDNGIGVVGPAYKVKIMNTKHSPTNQSSPYIYNGYAGVYYCTDSGANIINASWGGGGGGSIANLAASYAKDHGVLFLTSAGNSSRDNTTYDNFPTNAIDAYSVVASTTDDTKSSFSNFGSNSAFTAPGSSILSTYYGNQGENSYSNASGTSMASPIAAGVAALILSHHPNLTVDELALRMMIGCDPIDHLNDPIYSGKLGAGRVNPFNSIMFDKIPRVDFEGLEVIHLSGDDNTLNPGETLTFKIRLKNRENWLNALPTTATISTDFPYVNIINNTVNYESIQNGQSAVSTNTFIIEIAENCPIESNFKINLSYIANGGTGISYDFNIPFMINVTGNRDNWPLNTMNNPIVATMVFDINQDGENEILYITNDNKLHVITQDKEYLQGFPVSVPTLINQPITIIQSGSGYEIIVCGANKIYKINSSGQIVNETVVSGTIMSSVVAYDLLNNIHECFAIGTSRGFLYLFNNDMSLMENYPISLGSPSTSLPIFIDYNNNGRIDLIAATNNRKIHVIDALTGTHHMSSPLDINVSVITGLVAAKNNDIVYLFLAGNTGFQDNIKILNNQGSIIASNTLNFAVTTFPIIADMKNDGRLAFICTTNNGQIHIFDSRLNRLPGFPVSLPTIVTQHPILYDIDHDGELEVIVFGNDGTIYAIKYDGSIASGFPYFFNNAWQTSPILMDISGNNKLDILISNSINLYFLSLGIPHTESIYPMHAYSRTRNSVLSFDFVSEKEITIPPQGSNFLIGNYPNPFNPITTITFQIDHILHHEVKIDIFNIKGKKVLSHTLSENDIKNGFISWNADFLPSGIYFYRLLIDNKSIDIKKAVLLK